VKWSGSSEPTGWDPWIIIPSTNYIETPSIGPIAFRDIAWIEIDFGQQNQQGHLVESEAIQIPEFVSSIAKDHGLSCTRSGSVVRFADSNTLGV